MSHGYLEYVQAFRVYGWAFDADHPTHCLTVEIHSGDLVLGRTRADVFREDLLQGAMGDGRHGFVFDFVTPLVGDTLANVAARIVTDDGATIPLERLHYTPPGDEWMPDPVRHHPKYPAPVVDASQYPLFILGSTRSGTSAVAQAVLASGRFWGQDEGHMLDLLAYLSDSLRGFYEQKNRAGAINGSTLISHVPVHFLQQGLQNLFVNLMRTVAPTPWWMVKTPNHLKIQLAPRFLAIWPHGKFVFMKRRALEVIESRRRKFPGSSFEDNCRAWAAVMTAWRGARANLDGRTLEIDQMFLAQHPNVAATAIATICGMDAEQAARVRHALTSERPEQTGNGIGRVLRLQDLDWTTAERDAFAHICGPLMEEFGYTTDETYAVADGPYVGIRSGCHATQMPSPRLVQGA